MVIVNVMENIIEEWKKKYLALTEKTKFKKHDLVEKFYFCFNAVLSVIVLLLIPQNFQKNGV